MPTVITPIRSDNSSFGFSRELVPGSPVAPSVFPRWHDGSKLEYDLTAEDIKEGDGTRRLSQIIKNKQMIKIMLTCMPRINELGFFEAAAMGSGSDTIVTATSPSTLISTTAAIAGTSTSLQLAANTGLTGNTGTIQLMVGAGTANAESVTCSLPATGGSAPYTLSVASTYNGGVVKNNHAIGEVVAGLTTVNTSVVTSNTTIGATTIQLGNTFGLTGSGTATVVLSPGTANEEVAVLTTPGSSGTYTVASAGTLKKAHTIADVVSSPVVHTMSDTSDGNYYTIEVALGSLFGAAGTTLRVRSCKMSSIKRSGKAGGPIIYEMEWIGIASSVQNTPATVILEQHPIFLYTQGIWNLDGSTTGDALNLEQFTIEQKNNLDDTTQTEALTLAATNFGMIDVGLTFDLVFTNTDKTYLTYFGSKTGTIDAQAVGLGSFNVVFTQPDGFQSVAFSILTTVYTKTGMPEPKKDSKHYTQQISTTGTSNQGANAYVIQTTVSNMNYGLY